MSFLKHTLVILLIFVECIISQQQVPQHNPGGQPIVNQPNPQMNQQFNQPQQGPNAGANFASSQGQQVPNQGQQQHIPNPGQPQHHIPNPGQPQQQQHIPNPGQPQQHIPNPGQPQQHIPNPGQPQQHIPNPGQPQQHIPNPGQQQHIPNPGQQQHIPNPGQHQALNPASQTFNNQQFQRSQPNADELAHQQEMRRVHAELQHLRSRQAQAQGDAATYRPKEGVQFPPGFQHQQFPPGVMPPGQHQGFQQLPPGVPPPPPSGHNQGFQQLPPGVPPPTGQHQGFQQHGPGASPEMPRQDGIQGRIPPVQHQPISNVVAEPKFDLLSPSMAMDYRILVAAGKEDCFYQYVRPGAQFYVSFYTLRGGDGKAGYAVRDPKGTLVHPYQWLKESEYETTEEEGGYYSICVDNQFSRFEDKLVNFYITSFMYDEWDKGSEELDELNIAASNFTDGLGLVDHKLQIARQFMSQSRSRVASDWELLMSNRRQVALWSMIQVLVICASGLLHVYFVRKLFDSGSNRARVRS